ncbi:DDE_Tnp_1_7 domain-containing protein [Trichonephila clavipes]|nr:DDE_Tnp_1_7 domain-containing protein [Trichonephila clavipes]
MLRHIKNCSEEEAHLQLGEKEWSTTLEELDALISILYARVDIGNNHPKHLPDTTLFYNSTKVGVDITDQMARKYSVKARRLPVHVFYIVLDLAGNNSWILYKEVTGKKLTRRECLQQLIEVLRT